MDGEAAKIADLLSEVSETHHRVYRISDGADDDWASFYSKWLVTLSEFPDLVATTPVRSEVNYLLVALDREYTERHPSEPWQEYYATRMVEHFSR